MGVDLGQQQGEGHGQGTVVEAVDVGVVPVLRGRNGTRLRPQPPPQGPSSSTRSCLPWALGFGPGETWHLPGQRAPPQPSSLSLGVWPSVPSKRLPVTVQPVVVLPSTPRPPQVCADSRGLCRWDGAPRPMPSPFSLFPLLQVWLLQGCAPTKCKLSVPPAPGGAGGAGEGPGCN